MLYNKETKTLVRFPTSKSDVPDYTVPDGTEALSRYAFYSNNFLTSVRIADSVQSIGYEAFRYCSNLQEVYMNRFVTNVGSYMFGYCSSLHTLTIPDNCNSFSSFTFSDCNQLQTIIVPATVTYIDPDVYNHPSIQTFQVEDTDTSTFMDDDGVLYNKKDKTLVRFPQAKSDVTNYTVLDGTEIIGERAFLSNTSITSVVLPKNLLNLSSNAFSNNSSLQRIYFQADVPTYWGSNALYSLPDTCVLYYPAGNTSGWTSPTWVGPDNKTYNTATWIPEGTAVTPDPTIYNAALLQSMQKYFSGYSVSLTTAADIDGDGRITRRDAMILARYLAGWDNYASYFKP